jgi:hypothetical protein
LIAHAFTQFDNQPQVLVKKEALSKRRGDGALVAKEAPIETAEQAGNRTAVINGAKGETEGEQFPRSLATRWSLNP